MNSDIQYVSLRGSVSVLFLLLISLETMRYMGGGECVCVCGGDSYCASGLGHGD